MRRRLKSGTSLIEVLTVIVVFLVGILGLLQAFPTGLGLLRTTRSNTLASSLARSEMQRIQGSADLLPELIAPVTYRSGGTVIEVNASQPWNDLMPPRDADGGKLDVDGNILVSGSSIGAWQKVSGANKFNRVIGEGRRVPGPTGTGANAGSLLQLQFAPIYYTRNAGTGISVPGVLNVYANDLVRRWGNVGLGRPLPTVRGREYEFFFVDRDSTGSVFSGDDQIWVPIARDRLGAAIAAPLRISLAFSYNASGGVSQHEVIVTLDPATAGSSVLQTNSEWMVVDLKALVSQPGAYGSSGFDSSLFISADGASVRVQRMYQEIPLTEAFTAGNPFQYKALNGSMGALLINPSASLYKMAQADGSLVPLEAKADYTVLDWRVIRDSFRIPQANSWPSVRLALNSLKSMSTPDTDGQPYAGLGFPSPNAENTEDKSDFVLVDEATGGVILGNYPGGTYNSYFVDKRNGVVTFIDRDATTSGVQVFLSQPDSSGGWGTPQLVDAQGRAVKALYQASGEWSVQMYKAAASYRVAGLVTSSGLQPGECYVGGSDSTGASYGQTNRLYFPLSDLGLRVSVQEIQYIRAGTHGVARDQELTIDGTEAVNGSLLAYADASSRMGAGGVFDASRTGYSVRGVKGASLRVRVLWNPEKFPLLPDPVENFNRFDQWQRQTRPVQTEGFVSVGENQ